VRSPEGSFGHRYIKCFADIGIHYVESIVKLEFDILICCIFSCPHPTSLSIFVT